MADRIVLSPQLWCKIADLEDFAAAASSNALQLVIPPSLDVNGGVIPSAVVMLLFSFMLQVPLRLSVPLYAGQRWPV